MAESFNSTCFFIQTLRCSAFCKVHKAPKNALSEFINLIIKSKVGKRLGFYHQYSYLWQDIDMPMGINPSLSEDNFFPYVLNESIFICIRIFIWKDLFIPLRPSKACKCPKFSRFLEFPTSFKKICRKEWGFLHRKMYSKIQWFY